MLSSSHFGRILLPERSKLFKSHWSNQWLTLWDLQLNLIPDFFSLGVEAYGFRGDLCTCARIARVIKQEFDVSYLKAHLSRLLKQPGWTPQKPIDRARQRDEAEIARWRADVWPELK